MGIETVAAIATVVSAGIGAVSAYEQYTGAQDQKKARLRSEAVEKQRRDNQLSLDARKKQAAILNQAGNAGISTKSSISSSIDSVNTNLNRELGFSNEIDSATRQQIKGDASQNQINAIGKGISSLASPFMPTPGLGNKGPSAAETIDNWL